jgi:hypothetical protein
VWGADGADDRTDLQLNFEAMVLPADPGLTLVAYSAPPDSPSHDALKLLASWAATLDQLDLQRPKTATEGA